MLKNRAQDYTNIISKSPSLFDGIDQPSALPLSVYIRYWSSYLFHEDWLRNFIEIASNTGYNLQFRKNG